MKAQVCMIFACILRRELVEISAKVAFDHGKNNANGKCTRRRSWGLDHWESPHLSPVQNPAVMLDDLNLLVAKLHEVFRSLVSLSPGQFLIRAASVATKRVDTA